MRKSYSSNVGRFPKFAEQILFVRSRSAGPASWSAPKFFRLTKKIWELPRQLSPVANVFRSSKQTLFSKI